MAKKKYKKPSIQIRNVHIATILSGSTGATGEDVPWAAKRNSSDYEYLEEYDN